MMPGIKFDHDDLDNLVLASLRRRWERGLPPPAGSPPDLLRRLRENSRRRRGALPSTGGPVSPDGGEEGDAKLERLAGAVERLWPNLVAERSAELGPRGARLAAAETIKHFAEEDTHGFLEDVRRRGPGADTVLLLGALFEGITEGDIEEFFGPVGGTSLA